MNSLSSSQTTTTQQPDTNTNKNRRINAEITARIAAGEDLPPPPKTAIAGPEYFGFCQPEIADAIEALDPKRKCVLYWAGKEERIAAMAGLPPPSHAAGTGGEGGPSALRAPKAPRPPRAAALTGGGLARKGSRRRRTADSDDDDDRRNNDEDEEEEDAEARIGNRWSGVSRAERYRKRARNNASGDGGSGGGENGDGDGNDANEAEEPDPENPLPGFIDPITLAPVRDPAIAPSGHVCGMATWKAVLRSTAGGGSSVCPFTKKPLSWEQCVRLTHNNVDRYRDRIRT